MASVTHCSIDSWVFSWVLLRKNIKLYLKSKTTLQSLHLVTNTWNEVTIANWFGKLHKARTLRKPTLSVISPKHNIKRSYPFDSMNALHCFENLHAVILPSACQRNTRKGFCAILKSGARCGGRVLTNQTSEIKICVHKFACTYVTRKLKRNIRAKFITHRLRHE